MFKFLKRRPSGPVDLLRRVGASRRFTYIDDRVPVGAARLRVARLSRAREVRAAGLVEQLASGDPTVLCMTLTQGPPPVTVRLTIEEQEALMVAGRGRW